MKNDAMTMASRRVTELPSPSHHHRRQVARFVVVEVPSRSPSPPPPPAAMSRPRGQQSTHDVSEGRGVGTDSSDMKLHPAPQPRLEISSTTKKPDYPTPFISETSSHAQEGLQSLANRKYEKAKEIPAHAGEYP
ncbi:hypothetical protein N7488_000331 [Penicillium malachiteum]|nr:hypothetical protein N7488_000331 [Penicillium malachiteum]